MTYKTGDICQVSGIYRVLNHNVQHPKEITMVAGKEFPPCKECRRSVTYELKEKTLH
jgi:hypothetical protein